MSFQIVGLEIASTEIKLIQINKKVNNIEIVQFLRYQYPSHDDLSSAMKKIFLEHKIKGDLVVVGISSQQAVFRHLSFPFKNINKISKVLKYELEPHLPYPVEEAIFTFQNREDKDKDNAELFIAAVQKKIIDSYCRALSEAGIDPQYIVLDCLALYHLYLRAASNPSSLKSQEAVAMIDINEERILIVIVQGEYLLFCRSILTPAGLCFDQDTDKTLQGQLDLVIEKVDFTLYAFSSQHIGIFISKILLSGKISTLPNVAEYFTQKLDIETSFFDLLEALGKTEGNNSSFTQEALSWVVPLGLALLEVKRNKNSRFNLRQDELVYQRKYSQFKEMAVVLLLLFSVAVSLLMVDIYYRISIQQKKLDYLNSKISKICGEAFPKASNINDELLEAKKIFKREREKYNTYNVFSHKSLTHLQILKDLSVQIPNEIKVEFVDLSIDKNQVKIKGVADSFESVDRLKNSLQKVKRYTQTVVESAKVKGADNKVDFRLNINASDGA